jgi:hypothetical protein
VTYAQMIEQLRKAASGEGVDGTTLRQAEDAVLAHVIRKKYRL